MSVKTYKKYIVLKNSKNILLKNYKNVVLKNFSVKNTCYVTNCSFKKSFNKLC